MGAEGDDLAISRPSGLSNDLVGACAFPSWPFGKQRPPGGGQILRVTACLGRACSHAAGRADVESGDLVSEPIFPRSCNRDGAFASRPHRSYQPVFFRYPRRPRDAHFFTFSFAFLADVFFLFFRFLLFSARPPDRDTPGPGSIDFARLLHPTWQAPFAPRSRLVSGRLWFLDHPHFGPESYTLIIAFTSARYWRPIWPFIWAKSAAFCWSQTRKKAGKSCQW
jgi:hypothetical protein